MDDEEKQSTARSVLGLAQQTSAWPTSGTRGASSGFTLNYSTVRLGRKCHMREMKMEQKLERESPPPAGTRQSGTLELRDFITSTELTEYYMRVRLSTELQRYSTAVD